MAHELLHTAIAFKMMPVNCCFFRRPKETEVTEDKSGLYGGDQQFPRAIGSIFLETVRQRNDVLDRPVASFVPVGSFSAI